MVWFASICTLLPFQVFSLEGSVVQFEATHFGIMTVHGTLDEIKGQVTQATSDRWLFEGEIAVRSINTGNSSRDETLLLEQYLDHENFPTIDFSGSIHVRKDTLSIHTSAWLRGLQLTAELTINGEDPTLSTLPISISRKAIGLSFGGMDGLIGDEIVISIHTPIPLQHFVNPE